jgi:hypothetical protein
MRIYISCGRRDYPAASSNCAALPSLALREPTSTLIRVQLPLL